MSDDPGASVEGVRRKPRATEGRPKRMRSAVTNGNRLFVRGDAESAWSRRYRDLIAAHASDLGGADLLSEAQSSLIRRAAAIECELEQFEGKLSMGEEVDLDIFTRSASHLRRLHETLGIGRVARVVMPTIEQFAQQIEQGRAVRASQAPDASLDVLDAQAATAVPAEGTS